MELSDLVRRSGAWLSGRGPESDIVISTRVRLARNLVEFPFVTKATHEEREKIEQLVRDALRAAELTEDMYYLALAEVSRLDRMFLVERHLISKELAEADGRRGVAVGEQETTSLMVNEEDHIRSQVLRSGLDVQGTWEQIDRVDDLLGSMLNFAFSERLGFLTACPTNVGTGMRVSVMLHLPALVMRGDMDRVFRAVAKLNLAVRGLYGEGTEAHGDFYQVSNQVTLGKSEQQILDTVGKVVPRIVEYERLARQKLVSENREALEDQVWRSYGTLKTARTISSAETMQLLSHVRLGVNLGLVSDLQIRQLNELFLLTQPAHLQKISGHEMASEDRDVLRAEFIRQRLNLNN
jgi:protein arginine kinase